MSDTTTTPTTPAIFVPPAVAAMMHWAGHVDGSGRDDQLPREFVTLWDAMPEMFQAHVEGEAFSSGRVNRFTLLARVMAPESRRAGAVGRVTTTGVSAAASTSSTRRTCADP